MRILLTGGSGFIGKNIIESYLAEKHTISAPSHADLDLMDEDAVHRFIQKGRFDVILHTAAKPGHRAAKDATGIFYTNTRIFFNIVRNADYFKKMIVTGSGAIYDMRYYHALMSEECLDEHIPIDEHGLSKYVIYKYIAFDRRCVDLRLFGIFGKYEEYSIRFISNMICKAVFDLSLSMHQNRRFSYLFVEDFPSILDHFIENDSGYNSLNVTPDEIWELKAIAEMVLKIAGKQIPITIEKEGYGTDYTGTNVRLRSQIQKLEFTPMTIAIEKLFKWYVDNRQSIDVNRLTEKH